MHERGLNLKKKLRQSQKMKLLKLQNKVCTHIMVFILSLLIIGGSLKGYPFLNLIILGEEMAVEPQPKVEVKPVKTHTRSNKPDQPAATGKAPPNKVLFIQSLPSDITAEQLETIFSTCSGIYFTKVRRRNGVIGGEILKN